MSSTSKSSARVYTRRGDDGTTSIIGGQRVMKNDARIEAYGTVDELNAAIGLLQAMTNDSFLDNVQQSLFEVGCSLADEKTNTPPLDIVGIEHEIDKLSTDLPPLRNFVLPGGTAAAAQAHVCRTVCRRAERRVVELAERSGIVSPNIMEYLNRLSDYFFVLARHLNFIEGAPEKTWSKSCR